MIRKIVDFSMENRFLVIAAAILLLAWGAISFPSASRGSVSRRRQQLRRDHHAMARDFRRTNRAAGHYSLEVVMNGIPHVVHLRSFSLFGLSDLKLIFDDEEENSWNRERSSKGSRRSPCLRV